MIIDKPERLEYTISLVMRKWWNGRHAGLRSLCREV